MSVDASNFVKWAKSNTSANEINRTKQVIKSKASTLQSSSSNKWYSGDQPRLGEIYARINQIGKTDPESAKKAYSYLSQLQGDKSSQFYRPYAQPTNRARDYLASNGFNTSLLDNGWLDSQEANRYINANLRYDGTGNTPKSPTKKSSADEYNAFWLYQYQLAENDTNAAQSEIDKSFDFIKYWTNASDRNLSDDQIKQKYNEWYSKNCPTLKKMQNGADQRKPLELNKAMDFSDDTIDAMIWMARNPDYKGGIEGAMANSYLGEGKKYEFNPDISSLTTTGDNPKYKPYSTGSTMDDERFRFNRDYFDQQWVDDNWNRIMSGNNEEDKEALRKVQGAITYYDGLKSAYKDMKDEIADMLTWTSDADYIINEIKGNSAYKDLFDLDETMNKTDKYGKLKDLPDKFDYKFTEVEDYIRQACTDNEDKIDALGLADMVYTPLQPTTSSAVTTKMPTPAETPAPGPMPTISEPVPTPTPTPAPTQAATPTPTPAPTEVVKGEPVGSPVTTADVIGQYGKGNIDLYNRPQVVNEDGSVSTIRSMSFYDESAGKEILVPTVIGNRVVTDEEAIDHYYKTGEYLGMFDTPEEATAYALDLHDQQEAYYGLTEDTVTKDIAKTPVITTKTFSDTDAAIEEQTKKDYRAVTPTFIKSGTTEEKTAVLTGNTSYFDKCVQALGERVEDFNAALKTDAVSKIQKEYGDKYIVASNYENTQKRVEDLQAELDSFASEYYQLSWDSMAIAMDSVPNDPLDVTNEQQANIADYLSAPKGTYTKLDSAIDAVASGKDWADQGLKTIYEYVTGEPIGYSDESLDTIRAKVDVWVDYISKAQEDAHVLTADETARFEELKRKKEDIESQIHTAQEYLEANEKAYKSAKRDNQFSTMLYNDACKRDSSLDPSLFLGVEQLFNYAGNNSGYSYMANYGYDVQADEGAITAEDAAKSAYTDSVNYTAGYNSLVNTYNNLVKEGVQFTDQQKRNINDTLSSIKDYGTYSAFAALDGEEDFQSVVNSVIDNPSNHSDGTFIYDAIWQAYKYDAPVLTGGDDRYESIDVMNKKEMARYLYLKGTGQDKEADDYLKILCDPDKGMLTVRKTAETQESGYNLAKAANGLGSFLAVPLDIYASAVTWIAPIAYRAGQGITGKSVSPYNKAFRGEYLQKGLQQGYTESVNKAYADVFGEGSFFQQAGNKALQIGVGAGKMYLGSKAAGALFSGFGVELNELASSALETTSASVRIAKSAADVLIPSISSANDKYLEVLRQTHDETKAGQMFNTSLVSGLITYSVVMNGLKDNSTISSGIKGMFNKILKTDASVGLSTYVSSAIDKIVDKNVMGEDSKWMSYYNKFRNEDHYPDQIAKNMADEKTMLDINTEVWEAIKTSTYRTLIQSTVGYVATKADEINEMIKREFTINDVSKEAPRYNTGVALWDEQGRILDENGKVMLDADGNPVYKDMLDPDAFTMHDPGYDKDTGRIVDGNGNVIGKVPNGMIPNQLGGTVMKDRATGRTFESIGYIKDNASGNLYFVTSNGQFVPLNNVIAGDNPAIANMSQREFGLISEALDYYFYPGFGEQPTNYFIGDTNAPVEVQSAPQSETTTSQSVSGYLPNDTWGRPGTPSIDERYFLPPMTGQATSVQTPSASTFKPQVGATGTETWETVGADTFFGIDKTGDFEKDLTIISSIYNANPTAASVGTTAILGLPDPNMNKAAGQTFVGEVANGDSSLASTALLQLITKTQNPAETKTDIAMASLTNGAGRQALGNIIAKLQSGEAITEEDVNALHNGVQSDRSSSPVSFNEAVQQKVRDVRIGNETVRLTAGNPQIQSEADKVNKAKADLSKAEKDLDKAQSEYEVISQNAQDSLSTLGETGDKPDVGPVEQTLNQVDGADERVAKAEDKVAEKQAAAEKAQKDADNVESKILTENRVQAQATVDTQIQAETEAQEALAQAEFESNLATYTPTMPFMKPITIPLVNGDEVELLGAHGTGTDQDGNRAIIWATTNGYVMDNEIDWEKATAKDDSGKPLYPTYAQSAIDKATNYFAENGNAINPYKWFNHSLSAYLTDKDVDVDIIGLAGQNQDGDLVFMDKDGNTIPDTTLVFNKDPFTGEDGYAAQFNMTADVDYDELPVISREQSYREAKPEVELPEGFTAYPGGAITVDAVTGEQFTIIGVDTDEEGHVDYVTDIGTYIDPSAISNVPAAFSEWLNQNNGDNQFEAAKWGNMYPGYKTNSDSMIGTIKDGDHEVDVHLSGLYIDPNSGTIYVDAWNPQWAGIKSIDSFSSDDPDVNEWIAEAKERVMEENGWNEEAIIAPEETTPQPVVADITGNDTAFNYGDWVTAVGTKHNVIYPKDPENDYAIVVTGEGDDQHVVTIEGIYVGAAGNIFFASDHGAVKADEISPDHLSDKSVEFLKWAVNVASSEMANPAQGYQASQDSINDLVSHIESILPAETTQQDVDHLFGNDQIGFQYQMKSVPSLPNKALISPVLGNADGNFIDGISIDGNGDLVYTLHGSGNAYIDAHSADVNETKFLKWAIEAASHLKETGAIEDAEINTALAWLNDQLSMADDDIELGNADFQIAPTASQAQPVTDPLHSTALGKKIKNTDKPLYDWQDPKYHGRVKKLSKYAEEYLGATKVPETDKFKSFFAHNAEEALPYVTNADGTPRLFYRGYGDHPTDPGRTGMGTHLYVIHESQEITLPNGQVVHKNFYTDSIKAASTYAGDPKIAKLHWIKNWETAKVAMNDIGLDLVEAYEPNGSGRCGYQVMFKNAAGQWNPAYKRWFAEDELVRFRQTYGGNPSHSGIHAGYVAAEHPCIIDADNQNWSGFKATVTAPDGTTLTAHKSTDAWFIWAVSHGADAVIIDKVRDDIGGWGDPMTEFISSKSGMFKSVFNNGDWSYGNKEILAMKTGKNIGNTFATKLENLLGQPVSKQFRDVQKRLLNGESVPTEEVMNLPEFKIIKELKTDGSTIEPKLFREARQNGGDKWYDYIIERLPQSVVNRIEKTKDTVSKYGSAVFDEKGNVSYTGNIAQGKRLDFVIGLPSSGKSKIADYISAIYLSRMGDPDFAKDANELNMGGLNEDYIHIESKIVNDSMLAEAIAKGENVMLSAIGDDLQTVLSRLDPFEKAGYSIHVHMTDLDQNKALGRMLGRLLEKGRFLDYESASAIDPNAIANTFNKLKERYSGYAKWNTDVARHELPIPTEYSTPSEINIFGRNPVLADTLAQGNSGNANRTGRGDNNTGSGGGLTDSPTVRQAKKVKTKLKSPQDIMATFRKEAGIPSYTTNKFGSMAGAKGFYDPHGKYEAIRIAEAGNPNVGWHEDGHAVFDMLGMTGTDEMINNMINNNTANIDFSQYDPEMLQDEAAAEFMRRYMTDEADARQYAGDDFYNEFESRLATNPKLYKAVMKAKDAMRQWQEADTQTRLEAIIKYDKNPTLAGLKATIADAFRAIPTMIDKTAPTEAVDNKVREKKGVNKLGVSESLRAQTLLADDSQSRASYIMTDYMTGPDGKIIGDGFARAMTEAGFVYSEKNIKLLDDYMTCLVDRERSRVGKPVVGAHISAEDREEFISTIQSTRPDIVAGQEALRNSWIKFRETWLTNEGYLPKEVADLMDEIYPNYAPTTRIMESQDSTFRHGGKHMGNKYTIQKAKGGTQNIFSPFYGTVDAVGRVVSMVLQNRAARTFDNLYQQYPELGAFGRLIPEGELTQADVNDDTINGRQIQLKDLLQGKLDEDVLDRVLEIAKSMPGTKDISQESNILKVQRADGSVVRYQMYSMPLYNALAGIRDSAGNNPLLQAVAVFTRTMSMLTTGSNPYFAVRNLAKDFMNSVNYGTWASTPVDALYKWAVTFKELAEGKEEWVKEFHAMGGHGWGRMDVNKVSSLKDVEHAMFGYDKSTIGSLGKFVGKKLISTLSAERLNELVEQTSRAVEWRFGKHDTSTPEGLQEARLANREVTVDFPRSGAGKVAQICRAMIPFFNPSVQGTYRTARQFTKAERDDVGRRITKTVVNTAILSALALGTIIASGDKELKEQYDMLSDELKKNHLIIANPMYLAGKEGASPFVRIPLAQDALGYAVNWAVTNALWKGTTDKWAIGLAAGTSAIMDNLNPVGGTIFQPFIDAGKHQTWYGSSTIRSSQKDWSDPTVQYNADTPEIFRWAGRALNRSPEDVEYLATQYLGFIGQTVFPALSIRSDGKLGGASAMWDTLKRQWTADPTRSTTILSDFYNMAGSVDMITKAAKNDRPENLFRRSLTQEEVDKAYIEAEKMLASGGLISTTKKLVTDMYSECDKIDSNPTLTDSQKAQLCREKKLEVLKQVQAVNDQLLGYYNQYMKDESLLDHVTRKTEEGKYAHIPTDAEKMDDYFKNDTSEYMNRAMSVYEGSSGKDSDGNQLGGNASASLPHPSRKLTINKKEYEIEEKDWDEYRSAYKNAYETYVMNSDNGRKWDKLSEADRYSVLKQAHAKGNDAMRKLYKKKHGIK